MICFAGQGRAGREEATEPGAQAQEVRGWQTFSVKGQQETLKALQAGRPRSQLLGAASAA